MDPKIYIKQKNQLLFLNTGQIISIERKENITYVYTINKVIKTRENLKSLYNRLEEYYFFQPHRNCIVNLQYVERVEPWGDRAYLLSLSHNAPDAYLSRGRALNFFRIINYKK